jgi:hypothetical protein
MVDYGIFSNLMTSKKELKMNISENSNETEKAKDITGLIPYLQNCYQSYRGWQKRRGRAKREKKLLRKRLTFYRNFIRNGDLCFDIGANIGTRTEAFLELGAKVVAVEPQRS